MPPEAQERHVGPEGNELARETSALAEPSDVENGQQHHGREQASYEHDRQPARTAALDDEEHRESMQNPCDRERERDQRREHGDARRDEQPFTRGRRRCPSTSDPHQPGSEESQPGPGGEWQVDEMPEPRRDG